MVGKETGEIKSIEQQILENEEKLKDLRTELMNKSKKVVKEDLSIG